MIHSVVLKGEIVSEKILKEKYNQTKIMMVNHSADQLKKFCDSGLVLIDKKIHFFDEIDEALKVYREVYVRN